MASGVEFDEDSFRYGAARPGAPRSGASGGPAFGGFNSSQNQPAMVRFLMNHGIVKSPAGAQGVLVGLIAVNIVITIIVIKYFL